MTEDEQKKIFSRNLRKFVEKKGKMQSEIAKELGFNTTTFNMWCTGNSMPSTGKIRKLADYFKIGMTDLTDEKADEETVQRYTDMILNILLHDTRFAQIVLRYDDLSDEEKKVLCDFLEMFVLKGKEQG